MAMRGTLSYVNQGDGTAGVLPFPRRFTGSREVPRHVEQDQESTQAIRPSFAERLNVPLALALLLVCAPVMLLVALAIKLESPRHPVFYSQQRVGRDRRLRRFPNGEISRRSGVIEQRKQIGYGPGFSLWKFRTMVPDAEKSTGPVWAQINDERVTRVGKALRPLRLDELPQLFNVIRGEMSLIGPRPERPVFVRELCEHILDYQLRLAVSPGITGLAQVERDYDSSIEDVRKKLAYDLYYIRNRCMLLDLKILVKTMGVVVNRRGAR